VTDEMKSVNLSLSDFSEHGLYLIFPDQSRLVITREKIDRFASEFLQDPAKVPPSVKQAVDFQNCSICPNRETGEFCVALRPTLPFLERIDQYLSFHEVTVVFRGKNSDLLHVRTTTMQRALQYVSTLSLIHFCEVGREYLKYFFGIMPLMEAKEVAERIYMNIYWCCRGDLPKAEGVIAKFVEDIRTVSACQIKRLNTICKSDPFLNAFAITQVATGLVSLISDKTLEKSFNDFEKE